jgi:hypothetical protein
LDQCVPVIDLVEVHIYHELVGEQPESIQAELFQVGIIHPSQVFGSWLSGTRRPVPLS